MGLHEWCIQITMFLNEQGLLIERLDLYYNTDGLMKAHNLYTVCRMPKSIMEFWIRIEQQKFIRIKFLHLIYQILSIKVYSNKTVIILKNKKTTVHAPL